MNHRQTDFPLARGGFTLTELLVVMGVILALMGILFPIIGRSFDQSQAIQCQSNLKELSSACSAYSADNGGVLPWCNWNPTVNEPAGMTGWLYTSPIAINPYPTVIQQGVIWPYLGKAKIYRCPGDRAPWKLGPTQLITSYQMNGAICGFGAQWTPNRLAQMGQNNIEFWESGGTFKGGSAAANESQSQRHGDRGACIVCFDGHAELMPRSLWLTVQAKSPGRLWCNPKTTTGH